MPITFKCGCGKTLQAPDSAAGRIIECPACQRKMSVPEPEPSEQTEQKISVTCSCGKVFRAPANMAGHTVNCPNCGGIMTVPDITFGLDGGGTFDLVTGEPEGPTDEYALSERKCPNCGASMPVNEQFCIQCGTNLDTGERAEDVESEEAKAAAGKKEKASWQPVALALGIVAFALGVGFLTYYAIR